MKPHKQNSSASTPFTSLSRTRAQSLIAATFVVSLLQGCFQRESKRTTMISTSEAGSEVGINAWKLKMRLPPGWTFSRSEQLSADITRMWVNAPDDPRIPIDITRGQQPLSLEALVEERKVAFDDFEPIAQESLSETSWNIVYSIFMPSRVESGDFLPSYRPVTFESALMVEGAWLRCDFHDTSVGRPRKYYKEISKTCASLEAWVPPAKQQ